MRAILTHADYKSVAFHNPHEALSWFSETHSHFSPAIVDVVMPGLDGLTLAERFLETDPLVPVILYAGFSRSALPKRLPRNVRAVFIKPVTREEFMRVVRRCAAGGAQVTAGGGLRELDSRSRRCLRWPLVRNYPSILFETQVLEKHDVGIGFGRSG
jgi:DNA-binding NtrC family response regulator